MPHVGRPGDGRREINGLRAVVGLRREIKVRPVRVRVKAPPAVAGIVGERADLDQAAPLARASAALVGPGPVWREPKHDAPLVNREIRGAVILNDVVLKPSGVRAVHDQGRSRPKVGDLKLVNETGE